MVRDLLGEALGLDTREALLPAYSHVWRGRRRQVDLAFANVRDFRDLPDGEFRASLDRPKVVIDYPFDPAGPDGWGPHPVCLSSGDIDKEVGHVTRRWCSATVVTTAAARAGGCLTSWRRSSRRLTR
ncbi:MAG: hypothetical protein H0U69_07485 [Trueperaceae bacterium]|nr:hypothetical protein [Trueperaceae bacterium]